MANHIPVIEISKIDQVTGEKLVEAVHKWGFAFVKGSGIGLTAPIVDRWSAMHTETLDPKNQKVGRVPYLSNLDAQDNVERRPERIDPGQGGEHWFAERHDVSKGPSGSILRLLRVRNRKALMVIAKLTMHSTRSLRTAQSILTRQRTYALARIVTMVGQGTHSERGKATEATVGSITLLFQRSSQPGLELLGPHGEWSPVPVRPSGTEHDPFPPILINVGDLLSYWTNGFLKSTIHRVVFPPENGTADRYSIAYFCHPANETRLTPVPSEITNLSALERAQQEQPINSKVVTAEEHLRSRLAATYGWDKQSD
ncbi:MAG: hypothetical protein Q9216_000286 [Gyalolechia sp. 2 TL-2023]